MIKCETIGMLDRVVVNPVITSDSDVANYTFITYNGEVYLVINTLTGDNAGVEDVVIPAGEYLNGHLVKSLEGQKFVIDGKHIAYATGKSYSDLAEENILTINSDGKLAVASAAPSKGVYFEITDVGVRLTEAAVKAKILVAANTDSE